MKIKKQANKSLSTNVKSELYYKVRQIAKEENRSVAGLMRYLLYRYIEVYDNKNGDIKR